MSRSDLRNTRTRPGHSDVEWHGFEADCSVDDPAYVAFEDVLDMLVGEMACSGDETCDLGFRRRCDGKAGLFNLCLCFELIGCDGFPDFGGDDERAFVIYFTFESIFID